MENISEESFEIHYYAKLLLKNAWLIAGLAFLGLIGGALTNIFMRPMYRATVMMLIEKQDIASIENLSTSGLEYTDDDYYHSQIIMMTSNPILKEVCEHLQLSQYQQFAGKNPVSPLRRAIEINRVTKNRLITLSVKAYDRELAADIANDIAQTYVNNNKSSHVYMGENVIKALDKSEMDPASRKILESLPQVVNNSLIKDLKTQAAKVAVEVAKYSAKYTEKHPELIAARKQLATINGLIKQETDKIVRSIKIELSGKFSSNNIRIVSPADIPGSPFRPRKLINLMLGCISGFFIGLLATFIIEFMDQTVKLADDLEQKLNINFIGYIPYEKDLNPSEPYEMLLRSDDNLFAECVRNARTMVDFAVNDYTVLFVTSTYSSEGKTTTTANIAVSIAQTGKKTLLIDGNLRVPEVHKAFSIPNDRGVANLWLKNTELSSYEYNVRHAEKVENLDLLTAGRRQANVAEFLTKEHVEELLNWAVLNYERIIVDAPPVLTSADAMIWAKHIKQCLVVFKYGKVQIPSARIVIDKIKKSGTAVAGGIITFRKMRGMEDDTEDEDESEGRVDGDIEIKDGKENNNENSETNRQD